MSAMKLGMVESNFADLIWQNAPLTTKELVALCEKELNWKRTTTYTVLKKLCDRGIFTVTDRVVSVLISKTEFYGITSEEFIREHFQNSLPAFIAAFTARQKLTPEALQELKQLVDSLEGAM